MLLSDSFKCSTMTKTLSTLTANSTVTAKGSNATAKKASSTPTTNASSKSATKTSSSPSQNATNPIASSLAQTFGPHIVNHVVGPVIGAVAQHAMNSALPATLGSSQTASSSSSGAVPPANFNPRNADDRNFNCVSVSMAYLLNIDKTDLHRLTRTTEPTNTGMEPNEIRDLAQKIGDQMHVKSK